MESLALPPISPSRSPGLNAENAALEASHSGSPAGSPAGSPSRGQSYDTYDDCELPSHLHVQVRSHAVPAGRRAALTAAALTAAALTAAAADRYVSRAPAQDLVAPSAWDRAALFKLADCNGNGMLSLSEIEDAVKTVWPAFDDRAILRRAHKVADLSGDGTIGRREFGMLLECVVFFYNEQAVFKAFDVDGDQQLSLEEFSNAAERLGEKLSDRQVRLPLPCSKSMRKPSAQCSA